MTTIRRLNKEHVNAPVVPILVEYNLAVKSVGCEVRTSAIECTKSAEELLDFRQKYLSGGSVKGGVKGETGDSQGMLSLTREINPALPAELEANLRRWAVAAFEAVDGTGAPRIDFYCNATTGQVRRTEANPCPGS